MTDADVIQTIVSPSVLGGPGAADPHACSTHAMAMLKDVAGPDMRMASMSLDVASHPLGGEGVAVSVRVDKRARSIVFASVVARSGDRLVYSAQGLFSRGD